MLAGFDVLRLLIYSTATNSSSDGLLYPFTPAVSLFTAVIGAALLAWAGVAV